jgi:DNA-binding NarL/FixJ family response regulator
VNQYAATSTSEGSVEPAGGRAASGQPRPRLLVADDDPIVRAVLYAQLDSVFEVGMADDAESAIDLAGRERPDVALIDVQMPAGGGLHATRGIRAISPETAIVILSSTETDDSVVEFLAAGAMTYLRKGVPVEEIIARLWDAIAAHK